MVYMSEYVIYKMGKTLKSEKCLSGLIRERAEYLISFNQQKETYRMTYPSENVVLICTTAEKLFQNYLY